jgi:hypothetical protein
MSTTVCWKFGSSSDGLATKSTPFETDACANSVPAGAGPADRIVNRPATRTLARALHAFVNRLGARVCSRGGRMGIGIESILHFSMSLGECRDRDKSRLLKKAFSNTARKRSPPAY